MKTIFDCETEIEARDQERAQPIPVVAANGEESWKIFAHTRALLTSARGLLRIEQRCYWRMGHEVSDHPAVRPDMILEPAMPNEQESLAFVEQAHQRFIAYVRQQLDGCCA